MVTIYNCFNIKLNCIIEQSPLNHEIETKYLVTNRHYLDTITEPEQYKEITLIVIVVSWVLLIGSNRTVLVQC